MKINVNNRRENQTYESKRCNGVYLYALCRREIYGKENISISVI